MAGTRLALMLAASLAGVSTPAAAAAPARARTPVAERAVRWALSQVGVREIGNTNCGTTVVHWQRRAGWKVPPCREWCGAFVHEAFLQAGLDLRPSFLHPEDVLDIARARRFGLWAIPVRSVRRGDMVIFSWGDTDSRADHFGLVTRGYRPRESFVRTVDGNSGNAVEVARRSLRYAVTGVRVIPPGRVSAA